MSRDTTNFEPMWRGRTKDGETGSGYLSRLADQYRPKVERYKENRDAELTVNLPQRATSKVNYARGKITKSLIGRVLKGMR